MRLSQKGYSVAVIEKGRRYHHKDFAKTNWDIKKFLWAPLFKCFGIQQITLLKGIMLLHGAGVGGGSLVYANTLMAPPDEVFGSESWPAGTDWLQELKPHYELAKKMLGVVTNKIVSEAETLIQGLGRELGVEKTFHLTEVAVYFGEAGVEKADPYFNGAGPKRSGCIGCGACMVGCRENSKNTLDKNYLFFAEKFGTEIFAETEVQKIIPQDNGFLITATSVNSIFLKETKFFKAKKVIVASGVLGSLALLFKNRDVYKTLPKLSPLLGESIRTNGESLCGVTSFETHRDLSKGIAIGSAIHPDAITKIEPVRYNSGSSLMRFLAVPMVGSGNRMLRPFRLLAKIPQMIRLLFVRDWAKQSVILLVMQTVDLQMKLKLGRSVLSGFKKSLVSTDRFPSYLELAQQATQKLARMINGEPQNATSEVLLGIPATAHILGGCNIGAVVDLNLQLIGHPGIYVCDGSVIPANLGVNPSLTITAMAERFGSQFEIKDENLFKQRQIYFSAKESV